MNETRNEYKFETSGNDVMLVRECSLTYNLACKTNELPTLNSSDKIYEYVRKVYGDDLVEYESFKVILLNRALRALGVVTVATGGVDNVSVNANRIYRAAILSNAALVVLVHNHPSGNICPSRQDDNFTNAIKAGLKTLDITLLDHIIVTDSGYYSYVDECKLLS